LLPILFLVGVNNIVQHCSAVQCWILFSNLLFRPVFMNIVTGWAFSAVL
jgi:hypothetical protein